MILFPSFYIRPTIIDVYIVVSQISEPRRDQCISCLADERLVDVAGEEIPAVPPHLGHEREAVVELQPAVVGGVVEPPQRRRAERRDAPRRRRRQRPRRREDGGEGDEEEEEREAGRPHRHVCRVPDASRRTLPLPFLRIRSRSPTPPVPPSSGCLLQPPARGALV